MIGRRSAHRINTGKRDVAHLKFKKLKPKLGYGKIVDDSGWKNIITDQPFGHGGLGMFGARPNPNVLGLKRGRR